MVEDAQPSAREEQARRLAETLRRQLGPTLCGLMQAPDVVELMLNPDGRVWVDRLGRGMEPAGWVRAAEVASRRIGKRHAASLDDARPPGVSGENPRVRQGVDPHVFELAVAHDDDRGPDKVFAVVCVGSIFG
jgi:Flp pilus assembly CpaF family ATPase